MAFTVPLSVTDIYCSYLRSLHAGAQALDNNEEPELGEAAFDNAIRDAEEGTTTEEESDSEV